MTSLLAQEGRLRHEVKLAPGRRSQNELSEKVTQTPYFVFIQGNRNLHGKFLVRHYKKSVLQHPDSALTSGWLPDDIKKRGVDLKESGIISNKHR